MENLLTRRQPASVEAGPLDLLPPFHTRFLCRGRGLSGEYDTNHTILLSSSARSQFCAQIATAGHRRSVTGSRGGEEIWAKWTGH